MKVGQLVVERVSKWAVTRVDPLETTMVAHWANCLAAPMGFLWDEVLVQH